MIRRVFGCSLALVLSACSSSPEENGAVATSSLAAAQPIALSGDYVPDGRVDALARLTVDVIDTRMSDATKRLASVRAGGGNCQLVVSNTYRCTTMRSASEVAAASLDRMRANTADVRVTFGKTTGSPSLVTDAESLTEWEIPQLGSSPGGAFDAYTYRQLAGGLAKIELPASPTGFELIVTDADTLRKWERVVVSEGRWRWHEDMGTVILAR